MKRNLIVLVVRTVLLSLSSRFVSGLVSSPAFETLSGANGLINVNGDPIISSVVTKGKKQLVVILPQLGEFDSSEFCEYLVAVSENLNKAEIELSVIGIGDEGAGKEFCNFTGLSTDVLKLDPNGAIHQALELHAGPGLSVPGWVSDDALKFILGTLPGGSPDVASMVRPVATEWLNYMAMCAGIGAPGTLQEVLRGYFGDKSAPERFREDDVVKAGFITIGPGVGPVKMGPISYEQWFSDERGYLRPVELATVRLKNMVEVVTKWETYVTNRLTIAQRGATFLFDESGGSLYEYKHRGVLTYSETMSRPLLFLSDYIGDSIARNPLKLPDTGADFGNGIKGRGFMKPAGKAMNFLKPLFVIENKLQSKVLGVTESDLEVAKAKIDGIITSNKAVAFTYDLSPFSTEATDILEERGYDYMKISVGLEWFLLDKDSSALRTALLNMTGQSSLPHIFINGVHIGGVFSGNENYPGLAGIKEAGILESMINCSSVPKKNESINTTSESEDLEENAFA